MEEVNAGFFIEGRQVVILLDNASSHALNPQRAIEEELLGFKTLKMSNVRLIFLPPNTTCFTQPLDQGIIATVKTRYRKKWVEELIALWETGSLGARLSSAKPKWRDTVVWLAEAWSSVSAVTVQRCWWRTGCLPATWASLLPHVNATAQYARGADAADMNDLVAAISRLALGPRAMRALDFVTADDGQPTTDLIETAA
ncbi:hypothetical protein CLOM_g18093 [Closterium sp. NIES-68]|nr:hypothetical protein CLOM_g18093 [Closterium sp. NIES-68]GJP72482.1 hypothetical protein CLOP_g3213 [Closterium sp. NIES-67]